jgi:hypothetical protein
MLQLRGGGGGGELNQRPEERVGIVCLSQLSDSTHSDVLLEDV